ncbi:hypothetical protein WN943_001795 [Citrus x changshan-huyou]
MIKRLGAEGFISELCYGFQRLMDGEKGLITFESLKRNSLLLGLNDMMDDEIVCMLSEAGMASPDEGGGDQQPPASPLTVGHHTTSRQPLSHMQLHLAAAFGLAMSPTIARSLLPPSPLPPPLVMI